MPARPHPVDLVLHVGTDKTGSTSIQGFLRQNREVLAARNSLYPKTFGVARHFRFGMYVMPDEVLEQSKDWHKRGFADSTTVQQFKRKHDRRLNRELRQTDAERLIISDEVLWVAPPRRIGRIRRWAQDLSRSVRVVVYLRRQDDHVVSKYQQAVKTGTLLRIDQWAAQNRSRLYDYRQGLELWQKEMGPDSLVVRPFERERFVQGDLNLDFLDAAGVEVAPDELEDSEIKNESMCAEAAEVLRLWNIHLTENTDTPAWKVLHRPLVLKLAELPGPTLTLPDAHLDRLMARWEDSNSAVARDYLGDSSGRLFHRERKTSGTTTEQRLDPARMDFFLEYLELPEEDHEPMRRIAEREAMKVPQA